VVVVLPHFVSMVVPMVPLLLLLAVVLLP